MPSKRPTTNWPLHPSPSLVTAEAALGPVADRPGCRSEPDLHRGKDEDDAEADHQQCAERAEKVEVEPDTEPNNATNIPIATERG
ncbi:hypothetical protein M1D34_17265 [Ensifer sp. D2-11]